MGPTLGQAARAGWLISLKCERQRAGMKTARPCPMPQQLHVPSLIAAFGHDLEVDELQKRLRCPQCGSDRFALRFLTPPRGDAGKVDEAPIRRQMQPARGPGPATLANTPEPVIVFKCDRCGRRGEYKKQTLLQEFDGNTDMPDLLAKFAAAKGCSLAIANPDKFDLARARECKIVYDIERRSEGAG